MSQIVRHLTHVYKMINPRLPLILEDSIRVKLCRLVNNANKTNDRNAGKPLIESMNRTLKNAMSALICHVNQMKLQ